MVFMLQIAMSIKIFVTKIGVIIVFLNIGDECQSISNDNTMKVTGNAYTCNAGGGIEDGDDNVDNDDYNDDDDHVVIWL